MTFPAGELWRGAGPLAISMAIGINLVALTPMARAAESMDFACPAPGTRIDFDNGNSLIVLRQDGYFCHVKNARSEPRELYALLYLYTDQRKRDPSWTKYIDPVAAERIWPLVVGKRHQAQVNLRGTVFYLDYRVSGPEEIETPFGLHKALVVEMKEDGTNGYRASHRWWISPRLSYVIKYEFSDSRGEKLAYRVTSVTSP